MAYAKPTKPQRVYVKVNSDFDATGYMQPRAIIWEDGRTFRIDAVKDFRPAYRRLKKYPNDGRAQAAVREITKFFCSQYFEELTDLWRTGSMIRFPSTWW